MQKTKKTKIRIAVPSPDRAIDQCSNNTQAEQKTQDPHTAVPVYFSAQYPEPAFGFLDVVAVAAGAAQIFNIVDIFAGGGIAQGGTGLPNRYDMIHGYIFCEDQTPTVGAEIHPQKGGIFPYPFCFVGSVAFDIFIQQFITQSPFFCVTDVSLCSDISHRLYPGVRTPFIAKSSQPELQAVWFDAFIGIFAAADLEQVFHKILPFRAGFWFTGLFITICLLYYFGKVYSNEAAYVGQINVCRAPWTSEARTWSSINMNL